MAETLNESTNGEHRLSGIVVKRKDATLVLDTRQVDGEIQILTSKSRSPKLICPIYDVLWAEVQGDQLELSYVKRRNGKQSILAHAKWTLVENNSALESANQWCETVMAAAYNGVPRKRRLRIFVNPHGGPGKAKKIFAQIVEPIFQAAHCPFETTFTERPKHAIELAKNLSLDFDVLVLLSGDGLLHEIYNGFTEHKDPMGAFAMPVAPIPTGSANGMAVNLLGLKDCFDVGIACLNAIKGKPMKQDICSIILGGQRIFSYFSVALGLMADLDIGTEHLRWMGEFRFTIGYLMGVIKRKSCPITLEIKTAVTDKDEMVEEFRTRGQRLAQHERDLVNHVYEIGEDSLPVLKHANNSDGEGWVTFDKPLLYFYAGNSPYVGRDLMQFPVAHASDGLIDVVAQEVTSRKEMLTALDGADRGHTFWRDTSHYFKAHAYRITPHTSDGNLAIDGERYPLEPFTVECHRALGTLLSPTGQYAVDFDLSPMGKRREKQKDAQNGDVIVVGKTWAGRKGLNVFGCCS